MQRDEIEKIIAKCRKLTSSSCDDDDSITDYLTL